MCSLVPYIENVLIKYKQESAVAFWDEKSCYKTLSFLEVEEISNNITQLIASVVTQKSTCIGLYMNHNHFIPSLIISLQKCDLAFIFLDLQASEEINLAIITRLKLKWIISYCDDDQNNFLTKHGTETASVENTNLKLWNLNLITDADNSYKNICYVITTSGTTGDPKVVMVHHDCITANIVSLRNKFGLTHNDVIYFGTPLTFDPCMVELYLALTTGCTLLIVPYKFKINSSRLLNFLFPKEICYKSATVLQVVPSLFLRWSQTDIEFILQKSTCRILAFGGEIFPKSILELDRHKQLRLFNLYGITEVSCWASICEVTSNVKEVSLGKVLDNTIFQVRNEDGCKVSHGEGELYIGSSSRICYVDEENQSVLIKPLFRPSGDIVKICDQGIFYVCRKNNIIKRFGHKISLLEIEEIVNKHTNVPNTCIWVTSKCKLVLFLLISEFNAITKCKIIDKFRVKLLHTLPKQCFPDHIEILPSFPLTKHGKINKNSLEEIYINLIDNLLTKTRKTNTEIFLLLWCKYLGLSFTEVEMYYNCNFFDAGGNSVSAVQYLSEFKEITEIDYSKELTTLLFEKTLKQCCEFTNSLDISFSNKRPGSPQVSSSRKVQITKSLKEDGKNNIKLKICWQYNLKACVDSSPIVIKTNNSTMVAVGSFSHIFAILDTHSGNIISQVVLPNTIEGACCSSPLYSHIYVGCYDGKMYCIDVPTGNIIWDYSSGDRLKCTACLCLQNEAIVFGSYDKYVYCIKVQSGTLVWKTLVAGSVTSSPLCYRHKIYVATINGTCLCLSEGVGEIVWKCDIGVPVFGSPCIHTDNIIWPSVTGVLHSFSCETGKQKWTFEAKGNIYSSLTKHENFIIFGCHDHKIYCVQVDENGCFLNYMVPMESAVSSTPQILQCKNIFYIIAAANDGNIRVIDFSNGVLIESVQLQGQIFSSPAIENNQIYIGCRDNNLYCLSVINECDELNK